MLWGHLKKIPAGPFWSTEAFNPSQTICAIQPPLAVINRFFFFFFLRIIDNSHPFCLVISRRGLCKNNCSLLLLLSPPLMQCIVGCAFVQPAPAHKSDKVYCGRGRNSELQQTSVTSWRPNRLRRVVCMSNNVLDFPPRFLPSSRALGRGGGSRENDDTGSCRWSEVFTSPPPAVDVLALKECFIYWTRVAFGSLMSLWAKSGSANLQRHRGEEGEEDVPAGLDPLFPSCHAAFYVTRDLCWANVQIAFLPFFSFFLVISAVRGSDLSLDVL